ncbi:MAG TPA: C4-type zinc ribbon domain-containing protein [Bacteroidota bacterium]|nr:C4-type zinc ribbon domain-containing protein [Bacteroidota bacterium]
MEKRLQLLYSLQLVDTELQEIHEMKGDLPQIVDELQAKVDGFKQKIKQLNETVKQAKISRDEADVEIIDLGEKVEKYKKQQLQVKSNKQYDALTREIESAEERSKRLAKEMDALEGKMVAAKEESETVGKQLEESAAELEERAKELKEVNKEHEKEESKLHHEREKILVRIDKADLERYERIRKAKSGMAVVPVKRGACGGCFKRVPPQKILELRQNSYLYQCEHCGRILVSDQIVEQSSALA